MIFIVSGPGGVGKGTIVRELVARDPSIWLSRSWTTRARRPHEEADAYKFVTEQEFREHADNGGFLEWVQFMGSFYGTPVPRPPKDPKRPGQTLDVLLEIELEGAQKVRGLHPDAKLILVVPPSLEVQRERLQRRGDDPARIEARIARGQYEMEQGKALVDQIVVNDDLETAVQALAAIVADYRKTVD